MWVIFIIVKCKELKFILKCAPPIDFITSSGFVRIKSRISNYSCFSQLSSRWNVKRGRSRMFQEVGGLTNPENGAFCICEVHNHG